MQSAPKLFRNLLIGIVLQSGALPAEESVRLVMLQTTPKDAAALRTGLKEADEAGGEKVFARALRLADFKEPDPWRLAPVPMSKHTGAIKLDGKEVMDLGTTARLEGGKFGAVRSDVLRAEITLPAGGKGAYRSLETVGNTMVPLPGRWQERACWGDGKLTLMLWQYAVVEPGQVAPAIPDDGRWDSAWVQLLWFQASEADVAKLAAAGLDSRDKAMAWLARRAKLWKECGFRARNGERCVWRDTDGILETTGRGVESKQQGLSIDGTYTGKGDDLEMEWKAELASLEKEASSQTLAMPMVPGVWVFLPVNGIPGVNVVACRLSRD